MQLNDRLPISTAAATCLMLALCLGSRPAAARPPDVVVPPWVNLSAAEKAALVQAICAPAGCTEDSWGDPVHREFLGAFVGYFDGGTTLEAYASLRSYAERSSAGVSFFTVFLQRVNGEWQAQMEDAVTLGALEQIHVVRDRDRDIAVYAEVEVGDGSAWSHLCSLARDHGTHASCPLVFWSDSSARSCHSAAAQLAELVELLPGKAPDGGTVVKARIEISGVAFKTRPRDAFERDEACAAAWSELYDGMIPRSRLASAP